MSKTYELSYTAERIDEMLKEVDEHTIYSDATTEEHGLMSATDKTKLDALPTAQQIDGAFTAKVDKEEGKGLSENDYTDAEKAKVASALQTETDPTVPSWAKQQNKPSYDYSEIGNTPDLSGFITKSVNDLTNYYLKSETYTKAEVAALIGAIQQFHYEIYSTLPQAGQGNVLYLIGPTGSGADRYEEYVYANNAFTKIGDTSIDLSGYVTTSALNTALADYTTTSNLTVLLSNKADKVSNATNGDFAGLDANGNLTDSGKKASDFATASQGAKADTAYQKPSSGIPESDLSRDVQQALQKHFKGWWPDLATLNAAHTATEGDSAYVKDASPATTWSIYVYDATATTDNYWVDSGTNADTSNVQTFASGQEVNEVHIVNDTTTGGVNDVLSAEQGKVIGDEIFVSEELDLITFAEVLSGTAFKTTGEVISVENTYATYKITNQNYNRVYGTGSTYSIGYFKLAFYNGEPSESTLISGITQSVNYVPEEFDVIVPEGTVYILYCNYKNQNHLNTPECYTKIYHSKIQELENTVDGHSSQISAISETANSAITEANKCKEVIDDFVIKTEQIVKTVADNLTITGYYKDDTASEMKTGYEYMSFPLINVIEGQRVYFHNWKVYPETSVGMCWCYDNDGLPYNGSSARITQNNSMMVLISTSEAGSEYEFTIPSNCSQLGVSLSPPYHENAYFVVGEKSYEFTEEAIDMINSVVEVDIENTGDRAANYYLKGNSNIPSNNKKLGIIAAGQSNIDGRNSYSDYPYLSTNPNPKVHICKNTNGTFNDFEITDGGSNNDWSFDAIVYNLLTETTHGNQDEIYIMKKSMGGTSIDKDGATDYHWTADYEYLTSPTYSLLRSFESIIRKAVELQGSNFEIKAFLWHQGEGDAGQTKEVADRYYENLKNMLAYVRGVVGNPRLHFFCGTISNNNHADAYKDIVNAAYWQLASEDPYFHCVDMSNAVLEDTWHFNYIWSIYFGQKVYDMMIDAGIINGTKINPSEPT